MANIGLRQAFELETRNKYTKVNCELGIKIEGRELPTMDVIGSALEEALRIFQDRITESYKVIPPRVGAPAAPAEAVAPAHVPVAAPVPTTAQGVPPLAPPPGVPAINADAIKESIDGVPVTPVYTPESENSRYY
jgi:hypothetical protein